MKVLTVRLKNIILNSTSFLAIVFTFFLTKILRKRSKLKIKKVAWFGAYGNGNLGDDLIFYSLKRLLKRNNFDISLSIRDLNKAKNYGVPIFQKGEQFYDFTRYLKIIKRSNAVFLGGGGLLEYYYPSKQAFRMIMIYLCPLMVARIFNKPTFVLGIGVNKELIKNKLVKFVYKQVLSECEIIITRDEKSKQGLLENGVKCKIISSYDPVLSLKLKSNKSKTSKRKIGLLLWPYFLWPHFYENASSIDPKKEENHNNFVDKINLLVKTLGKNYELHFLTFHFSDTLLYKELDLNHSPKAELVSYIRKVSSMDLIISMRYHGQITSFLTLTPVIAISVQQKMDAIMKNYEFEYLNNNVNDFSVDKIIDQINSILINEEYLINCIKQKNELIRKQLKQTYYSLNFNN